MRTRETDKTTINVKKHPEAYRDANRFKQQKYYNKPICI